MPPSSRRCRTSNNKSPTTQSPDCDAVAAPRSANPAASFPRWASRDALDSSLSPAPRRQISARPPRALHPRSSLAADNPRAAFRDARGFHHSSPAPAFAAKTDRADGEGRFVIWSCVFLRGRKKAGQNLRCPLPAFRFGRQLFTPGARDGVILGAPIVFRHAPLGANPSPLLQVQQRGINRSLIELRQMAAGLLDAPRNAVAVQAAKRLERFENHQAERAGQDFVLVMFHKAPVERQQKSKSPAVGGQQVVGEGLYPCGRSDRCQSHLKAISGSTFVARRAGSQQANSATPIIKAATTPNATGSNWLMSTSAMVSRLEIAAPPAKPMRTPIAISLPPCRRKSVMTSRRCAPKAMRMPISRVRWLMMNVITP